MRRQLCSLQSLSWCSQFCHMNAPHVYPATGLSTPSYHPVRPFCQISVLSLTQPVLASETVGNMAEENMSKIAITHVWFCVMWCWPIFHLPNSGTEDTPRYGVCGTQEAGIKMSLRIRAGPTTMAILANNGKALQGGGVGQTDPTELSLQPRADAPTLLYGGLRSWT